MAKMSSGTGHRGQQCSSPRNGLAGEERREITVTAQGQSSISRAISHLLTDSTLTTVWLSSWQRGSATAQQTPWHGQSLPLYVHVLVTQYSVHSHGEQSHVSHCRHQQRNVPPAWAVLTALVPGTVIQTLKNISRAWLSNNNVPVTSWAWPAGIAPSNRPK